MRRLALVLSIVALQGCAAVTVATTAVDVGLFTTKAVVTTGVAAGKLTVKGAQVVVGLP